MSKIKSKHESKCKCVECAAITPNQIVRYLDLVDRRLEILTSGVNWRPEYEGELVVIDQQLAKLRPLVEDLRQRYQAQDGGQCRDQMPDQDGERKLEPLPCDGKEVKEITGDCMECDYLDFCTQLIDQDTPDSQQPQTLQLQTGYCVYDDVLLRVDRYQANNSLCIQAYNHTDGPIARLTVCLPDTTLGDNCAFVDTNNCPWAEDFVQRNHLGTYMGLIVPSGYCVYPLYQFDIRQLAKYCATEDVLMCDKEGI